ncbi:hypothetical protein H4S06_001385 [Coemansia sp. BCRC 34490]|nr:hypothetical protein H4S06_001385 [Coemansia sp. BCRC 34490]
MADDTEILPDWVRGTPNYRTRAYVVMGVGLAYLLFVLVTTAMFIVVARNKRSGLEKRSAKLVLFQALGCYLVGVDGLVTAALNNWACFGKLWLFNVGFVMSLAAMSARAFHLFVVYRVHELASRLSSKVPGAIAASGNSIRSQQLGDGDGESDGGASSAAHQLVDSAGMIKPGRLGSAISRSNPHERIRLEQRLRKYRRLLRFTTDRVLLVYLGLLLLFAIALTLVINATDKQFALRPVNIVCEFMWGFIPCLAIIVVYLFAVFPVILWRVWRNNDAYGIRNDLIVCDTVGILVMITTLVWVLRLHETQQIWPGLSFIWVYALFIHISSVLVPLVHSINHMRRANDDSAASDAAIPASASAPVALFLATQQHPRPAGVSRRRAEFNGMLDSASDYHKFRQFAASCFCSELTSFIEEYQVLKSLVLVLLDHQIAKSGNSPHARSLGFSALDSAGEKQDSGGAGLRPNRLSQSIAESILSQDMVAFAESFQRTSVTVSILDTVNDKYPGTNPEELVFPKQLVAKVLAIHSEFVDPASLTSVNAPPHVVRKISARIDSGYYHVSIFDDIKDEVLLMLYSDVYTRYIAKK